MAAFRLHENFNKIYISEWISLENIVAHDFGKKYLTQMKSGESDECEDKEWEECVDKCTSNITSTDKNICVSRNRIKRFTTEKELANKITGKNRQKYKLVDSEFLSSDMTIYYLVFISEETNHIYVLFPTGRAFCRNEDDYDCNNELHNPKINQFLNGLITKLLRDHNRDSKIVICGHSMGCVLALHTAMLLKTRDEAFFHSRVVVVGSGPFKYSDVDLKTRWFYNLSNIKIFVFVRINSAEMYGKKQSAYIDSIVSKPIGPTEVKFNYEPLTYISKDGVEVNDSDYDFVINKNTAFNRTIHSWKNYYSALEKYIETVATKKSKSRSPGKRTSSKSRSPGKRTSSKSRSPGK